MRIISSIKIEYKLISREIKKVDDDCDPGVGFDNTFKVNNYIFVCYTKEKCNELLNGKKLYFIGANVYKIYKTLVRSHRIVYSGLGFSVEKWKLMWNIKNLQRRMTIGKI